MLDNPSLMLKSVSGYDFTKCAQWASDYNCASFLLVFVWMMLSYAVDSYCHLHLSNSILYTCASAGVIVSDFIDNFNNQILEKHAFPLFNSLLALLGLLSTFIYWYWGMNCWHRNGYSSFTEHITSIRRDGLQKHSPFIISLAIHKMSCLEVHLLLVNSELISNHFNHGLCYGCWETWKIRW